MNKFAAIIVTYCFWCSCSFANSILKIQNKFLLNSHYEDHLKVEFIRESSRIAGISDTSAFIVEVTPNGVVGDILASVASYKSNRDGDLFEYFFKILPDDKIGRIMFTEREYFREYGCALQAEIFKNKLDYTLIEKIDFQCNDRTLNFIPNNSKAVLPVITKFKHSNEVAFKGTKLPITPKIDNFYFVDKSGILSAFSTSWLSDHKIISHEKIINTETGFFELSTWKRPVKDLYFIEDTQEVLYKGANTSTSDAFIYDANTGIEKPLKGFNIDAYGSDYAYIGRKIVHKILPNGNLLLIDKKKASSDRTLEFAELDASRALVSNWQPLPRDLVCYDDPTYNSFAAEKESFRVVGHDQGWSIFCRHSEGNYPGIPVIKEYQSNSKKVITHLFPKLTDYNGKLCVAPHVGISAGTSTLHDITRITPGEIMYIFAPRRSLPDFLEQSCFTVVTVADP